MSANTAIHMVAEPNTVSTGPRASSLIYVNGGIGLDS